MSLKWGEILNSSTFYLTVGLLQLLPQEGHPSPSRDRDDERFIPKHRWTSPGSWHLSLAQLCAWAHLRICPGCVKLFCAVYLQTNGASLINYQPSRAAAEEFSVSPPGCRLPSGGCGLFPNRWDKGKANCTSPQVTGKTGGKLFHGFPWLVTAWKSQILCPRWALTKNLILTISSFL